MSAIPHIAKASRPGSEVHAEVTEWVKSAASRNWPARSAQIKLFANALEQSTHVNQGMSMAGTVARAMLASIGLSAALQYIYVDTMAQIYSLHSIVFFVFVQGRPPGV